jgi:hypothetical protein
VDDLAVPKSVLRETFRKLESVIMVISEFREGQGTIQIGPHVFETGQDAIRSAGLKVTQYIAS